MPENPTSENERQFNPEANQEAIRGLRENFDIDAISQDFTEMQETVDPYSPGFKTQEESYTENEFDQGALYDLASGFWNSFVVGSAEGLANLLPTVANAVYETDFANYLIDKVNKIGENYEYIYSDDYYKPIESFDDINSSHFWAGLGNGIGFVAGIGKFAKAGQMFSKGSRALKKADELIEGADDWFKAGAKARNYIDDTIKNIFGKSKAGKIVNKTPKFNEGVVGKVDPLVLKSLYDKKKKIASIAEKSLKNSARLGSFFGGTTMMYGMVQEEAKEAGLSPTSAARFALGVASVVSLTEGAALEWIGKIPARSVQKQLVKAASKRVFKSGSKKSPKQLMDAFLPIYSKSLRAVDVFEGAAVEFGQEFGQTYIEEGAKQMYDEMFAADDAVAGKGKFGREVFDLDADSVGGFFLDGKDAERTFTNSVFAGLLGGIIGGGMAGTQLRAFPGERHIGNESMFNLIADDVVNDKSDNRTEILDTLEKARKKNDITQKQYDDTISLMNEMAEFVSNNNNVKTVSDPVAQYQMFNLSNAYKNIGSKIKSEEAIREVSKNIIQPIVDESVKIQNRKNGLFEMLMKTVSDNANDIYANGAETKNANQFNDKVLAYQAIADDIDAGAISTEEDLQKELDKLYKPKTKEAKETEEKVKKEPVTKEEPTPEVKAEEEYKADKYAETLRGLTEEELLQKEQDVEEDTFKEEKKSAIKIEKLRRDLEKKTKPEAEVKPEVKGEEEIEVEEKPEETKVRPPVTYTTAKSFNEAAQSNVLTDEDIVETYNQALDDIENGTNRRSANAIKNTIENNEDYLKIIKSKQDEKTEDGKKGDKDSEEETKVEAEEQEVLEEEIEKKVEPTAEETTEVALTSETVTDDKGRTFTYFENTETKNDIVKTTYTFNRSDKDSAQRNTTGVKPEIALYNKGYEATEDSVPDGAKINKVFEVRVDKNNPNKAAAGVEFINENGETFRGEIVIKPTQQPTTGTTTEQKAEEPVVEETTKDVGGDITGLVDNFDTKETTKLANQKNRDAQKNIEQITKNNPLGTSSENDEALQRKGVISKSYEAKTIADNIDLYNKIKGHFQKMFPNIPVKTVNKLFDKYGVEVLGKVAKDGITISEEAFQNTLVHEYAHVYIDLIADKEMVDSALDWIKTTQYFTDAKNSYPNDTVKTQSMEALVQALSENAVPKLEEKLSTNQITRWMSIAKKLWRAIKRLFTGVKQSNYVDYLSDALVFDKKPIMVDTSYLTGQEKYERKAIDKTDANFNNRFLLRTVKKFALNALIYSDEKFKREDVLANIKKMISDQLQEGNTAITTKLNRAYLNLKSENKEFKGKPFNELSFLQQTEVLLDNAIYDDGVTYQEHIYNMVEHLAKLPTEGVKESEIDRIIAQEQNTEVTTGKIEKEQIKGSKKMITSVNSILARLTDSEGKTIHQNDVFAYLTQAAMKSATEEELKDRISKDAKKENNDVPLAILNVLLAVKEYDKDFGRDALQTILKQTLSMQSIPQRATNVSIDADGVKTVKINQVSRSLKRRNREAGMKRTMVNPNFLDIPIIGLETDATKKTIERVISDKLKSISVGKGYQYFAPNDKVVKVEADEVERLGDLLFDLDGDFRVLDYTDYFINNTNELKQKNSQNKLTVRAKQLQVINSEADINKKRELSAQFFMADALNVIAEQLNKNEGSMFYQKVPFSGKVSNLMNFASYKYDVADNANMFINSLGNTVSTIRQSSWLNTVFKGIAMKNEFAKIKNNEFVKTPTGDVYLYRDNPVFQMIYSTGDFRWDIDDAINYENNSIKEHNRQNSLDLFLNQLVQFSNDQNRTKYYQKAIINDRSHSNFIQVLRLDNSAIRNHLNEQRRVDEYYLNQGYERIDNAKYLKELTKEEIEAQKLKQKKAYLEEFNKISLNFAYDVDGKVVVKNFDPVFLGLTQDALKEKLARDNRYNEVEKKGIDKKVRGINKEIVSYKKLIKEVGLLNAIEKDHVGDKKLYKNINELLYSFVLNDKVNRLAVNDIISEPIAKRLIKKGKVDKSNIIKRNSGYDSTGVHINLSKKGKKVMTVVYQLNDKENNPISDSFLWRSKGMTEAIQKELGDKALDEISYNSKDGEYMIDEKGNNIYHKNSSVNYIGDKENNNIIDIAKAMMPDNYQNSNYYRISKMLDMLEEKFGQTHHIQIIDKEAIKGSMADIDAMSIEDLYSAVETGDFKKLDKSKYEYTSQNFYIPFNENKKRKPLARQKVKLASQAIKIFTNNSNQDDALLESKELENLIVQHLEKQMGVKDDGNYRNSTAGKTLFGTNPVLNELLNRIDDLQDPDTAQLLKDIIASNKEKGKLQDNARKKLNRLNKKSEEDLSDKERLEVQAEIAEAEKVINEKDTINKLDHPALMKQIKQVILSKLQSYALDIRVPGAYLKMVPDIDQRLGDNEIILPWSMFGETREQAEKFLNEQNEKGGIFVPGVRVPASDAISTLNARVVGLIEGDANIAVLPHKFTVKSDADHDGDKVFIYRNDLETKDGKTLVKENTTENRIYETINRLTQSKDYNQRIEDGSIDLDEFTDLVNKIDEELKQPKVGEADVKAGVSELFEETPALADIGTERQYSAYLNTITSEPIVYKGFRNKSGVVHKTPNHTFYTADKNIATKWYKSDEGILTYAVLKGSSESFNAERKQGESKVRQDEENFINKSNANYVKLQTLDIGGEQLQYVVNKKNMPLQLGSDKDLEGFKEFVSKPTTKKTEGLPSKFDYGTAAEMAATDARMSFGETAVGILAVAGKLNSALYQANTTFKEEKVINIDGKPFTLDKINAPETSNEIALMLQAALDMSANPVLLRSGIDGNNINVVVAMMVSGIDLETVIKFVNKEEIKNYYKKDQRENNAFTKKANKNKFKESLADVIEKKEEGEEKQNLETLKYFAELSQELNTITSILQLDGNLPNDGYLLRDLNKAFNIAESEEIKTKLNYRNYANRPINRHYKKTIDLALDIMSHHFITENDNYYKEIDEIIESRKYSDISEYDPSVEKRRIDDMFSLMLAQNLLNESQISDILENGVESIIENLKENVRESIEYSYKQVTKKNTVKEYTRDKVEDLPESQRKVEQNNLRDTFNLLKQDIEVDGGFTNIGAYIENVLQSNENDLDRSLAFIKDNINENIDKNIVKTVQDFVKYKEFKETEMLEMNEKSKNKFIKLLQLANQENPETGTTDTVLTGKQDVRFLTTIEKQLAKRDFEKLDYDVQNRFLSYQLFKFGLSNKLGSLISIMPNQFTIDYLRMISNIKSIGFKENKLYKFKDYRIAQSYNDLNYPVKTYTDVVLIEEGNKQYAYVKAENRPYRKIKGKDGVRFKIKGDDRLYEYKKVAGLEVSEVKEIESFAAERRLDYTVFNNKETVNLEDAEDLKNRCKKNNI